MNHVVGVDLGGTSIRAALATVDGAILTQDTVPTEAYLGPLAVLDRIAGLIRRLQGLVDPNSQLVQVGMGVPGLLDLATGTTRFLPNLPTQWRDIPVARLLQERVGCPVRLLNDVRTATLGELRFGHGKQHPRITLAFFSIGTGVGGGVAIDGRLWLGPIGAAGELGHQTIQPNGPRCGCGNYGCLEALASGPAIIGAGVRLLRNGLAPHLFDLVEGDSNRVTPGEMVKAAEAGDTLVLEALTEAGCAIGIAAANVVTILHPDWIVLGGGVIESGDLILDAIRKTIRQRVGMIPTEQIQVERSLLGDQAGLVGAVALALEDPDRGSPSPDTISSI